MLNLVTIISLTIVYGNGLKILGIFPHEGRSHFNLYQSLIISLVERGHEVTVVSHFPQEDGSIRYRDISIRNNSVYKDFMNMTALPSKSLNFYQTMRRLDNYAQKTCTGLQHENMKKLVNSNETFDIAIIEFFNTDCFLGLMHKFKIPFIGISSHTLMPWTAERLATISNPAFVPVITSSYSDEMSFLSRVCNSFYLIYSLLYYKYVMVPNAEREAKKLFENDLPPLDVIARNSSLMLLNTHFTLNGPRTFGPNVIEIGGMHIGKVKKLPENIEKWINESKHGVIYLSMGTMINGRSFTIETIDAFIRAFDRLPQRVLWKWGNETFLGNTDKILTQQWMPQFDILSHPNVKAFISHGGLLSTTEAVHCGVPMVVLPQYGDQFLNAGALKSEGGGLVVDSKTITEDIIYKALKKVLDYNFKKQVEELSVRFRDRPMSPSDTAIFWIEYVARHKGAYHIKTAAVGMPWYQYLLVDVILFLVVMSITIIIFVYFCIKKIKFVFKILFKEKSD